MRSSDRISRLPSAPWVLALLCLVQCASRSSSESPSFHPSDAKITFLQKQIEFADFARRGRIDGVCENRAGYHPWVLAANQQMIESGKAHCRDGLFQVTFESLPKWPCGQVMLLNGVVKVSRRCAPTIAMQVTSSRDHRDQCFIELDGDQAEVCQRVCYRDGQVVVIREAMAHQCRDIHPVHSD